MLTAESFKKALDFVQHVINPEHEMPGFRGVLFDFDGDSMYLVATDGMRMAAVQCLVPPSDLKGQYIIAPDQVKHLVFPGMGADPVKFSHANGARAITVTYGDCQAYATIRIMDAGTLWPRWREVINKRNPVTPHEKGYPGAHVAAACIAAARQFGQSVGFTGVEHGPMIVRALELPKPEWTPGVVTALVALSPRLMLREPEPT
jgi:hypothetical protein